jgi:hypothetical protein
MTGERRPADLLRERLEGELLEVLRAIALPKGVAEAVDAAVAAMHGSQSRKSRQVSLKAIDARLERQSDLYDLGDISSDEYMRRREDLNRQRLEFTVSAPQPLFVRQRTMLRSLVEDWEHVMLEERKKVVASIFEVVTADEAECEFTPRETWKDFVRAVVPATNTNESTPK